MIKPPMKKFLTFFLLFFCLKSACLAVPADTAKNEEISPAKKLQIIQQELNKNKQHLQKTKEQQAEVLGRLAVIRRDLNRTQQILFKTNKKIKITQEQVNILGSELTSKTKVLQTKEEKFKNRLQEIYKGSAINYLEFLISSRSMSDFFNRAYFFKKVAAADASLVQGVRAMVREVSQKKGLLEDKNREIRSMAKEIASKKEEISAKAEEKKKIYAALEDRRREYANKVAELERSSAELERLIISKENTRRGEGALGSGTMAWPARGRLTSFFGYRRHPLWGGRNFHTGLDIATKYGTPVGAADAGEVIFAGWWDGYGKAVVVDHGRGTTTVYGHLSRIYKQVGDVLSKGQILGLIGSTGYSTGPHLHFEVRKKGKPVNPRPYLP